MMMMVMMTMMMMMMMMMMMVNFQIFEKITHNSFLRIPTLS